MKTTFLVLGWTPEIIKIITPDRKKSEDPIDSKNLLEWETPDYSYAMRKEFPLAISCNKQTGERLTLISALFYFANGLHKTPEELAINDSLLDIFNEWKKISSFKFVEVEIPEMS